MSFFGCDKNITKRIRKNYKRDENTYMLKKVFPSLQYPAFYPQFSHLSPLEKPLYWHEKSRVYIVICAVLFL